MKGLIVLLIALASFSIQAQPKQISWMTLEDAIVAQQQEPKKIMVFIYAEWCGYCKKLDSLTLTNQDVVNYVSEHFYAVKFNGESNDTITYKNKEFKNPNYDPSIESEPNALHEFAEFVGLRSYPTLAFTNEQGNLIVPIGGYKDPKKLEIYLKLIGEDIYKTIATKEDFKEYLENFKPQFKS